MEIGVMDFIVNECSLEGQFEDYEDFVKNALDDFAEILAEIRLFPKSKLLKKSDLYAAKVTKTATLMDIIFSSRAKVDDRVRRVKNRMAALINEPVFWDSEQYHQSTSLYYFSDRDVSGTSIAEAFAREAGLLSFKRHSLYAKDTLIVSDAYKKRQVFNVFEPNRLARCLYSSASITFEEYVRNSLNSKLNFSEVDSDEGFCLISPELESVFEATFMKFESLRWSDILADNGLDYKKYNKNKETDRFFSAEQWRKGIFKFRVNQVIRCFGRQENGIFFVYKFDLNHKMSDLG